MARKPKIQCRIERDTDDAIQRYCDDLDDDVSQSEAVRHLLRAGLAAKGHPVAATDGGEPGPPERLASARTALTGALLFALSALPLAGATLAGTGTVALGLIGLSGALSLLGLLTIWAAALAQLALGRPLRALALSTDTA